MTMRGLRCAGVIAVCLVGLGPVGAGSAWAEPAWRSPIPVSRPMLSAPRPAPSASLFPGAAMAAMPAQRADPRADRPAAPGPSRPAGLTGALAYAVVDVETGALLAEHDPDRALAPASVAKIPTALYALAHLGPDHRFETRVLAAGPVRDRVLQGDLILEGGGAPALDSDALAALAAAVAARIDRVEGRLRVSHGSWPVLPAIAAGQPVRAAYNPAVAGLNLNFNRVRLAWTRRGDGIEARLDAHAANSSPPVTLLALSLEEEGCACPTFAHETGGATPADPIETWRVRRSLLTGEGAIWLPVRQPGPYAGDVFMQAAASQGLALTFDPAPASVPPDAVVLARHAGAPTGALIDDMLRYSTNLTAEMLGLAAARAAGAAPADLAASAAAMGEWTARLAGLAPGDRGLRLANHSGLSTEGLASPRALVRVLRAADAEPDLGPQLRDLLREHRPGGPIPDGTRILAKTGTMYFTRGLAGYLQTPAGRRLAFAIIANDHARRPADGPSDGVPPGTRAWRNAAVSHEGALLAHWARTFDVR